MAEPVVQTPPTFLNVPAHMQLTCIKEVFIPAPVPNAGIGLHAALNMPDAADTIGPVEWEVPEDFINLEAVYAVVVPAGTGNIYGRGAADYAQPGELYNTHTETGALFAYAVTLQRISRVPINDILLNLTVGDKVGLRYSRIATNPLDTINATVYFLGMVVRYYAKINRSIS